MTTRKLILYIILLTVLSITAYVILVVIPTRLAQRSYDGAKQLGKDISNVFQFTPRITVNNTVVLQQQSPILELAVLRQQFSHKYNWENTRLRSTKTITISGNMEAKVGFDLNKKFAIDIHDEKATVTLPEPRLLSLEPLAGLEFKDENGLWNWVNNDDRSAAINGFQADARKFASETDFVTKTKAVMEEKLRAILSQHVKEVEIRYEDAPIDTSIQLP